jgi:hypothetical protein
MAAIASKFGRFFSAVQAPADAVSSVPLSRATQSRLRAFPNEDIYFHMKHIDNSTVIRQADPESDRASVKMVMTAALAAVLVIGVLMPKGYGVLAGYQIQALRQEQEKLLADQAALELREASLMSPERMQVLAREQQFVDPTPERIVYLEGQSDATVAQVTGPRNVR